VTTFADHPDAWHCPGWHPDYGDAAAELEMLRAFSLRLIRRAPRLHARLDIFEPGYMKVDITRGGRKLGELYTSPGCAGDPVPGYRLYLFGDHGESEHEFREIDEGVGLIESFDP